MYTMMIADDDELVRERILSVIPMKELGLSLCAEAENGIQALEKFELWHPQIVIMDIHMPFMDGLEVSRKILESNQDVNIIIITGYGTIETARDAIRSGFVDFLLKPVDYGELTSTLKRIIGKIEQKKEETLERSRMERLLKTGMPEIRNKYLTTLLQKAPEEIIEEDCFQHLKDFGMEQDASHFCVLIVLPDYRDMTVEEQVSMQAVLEEQFAAGLRSETTGCLVFYDTMQRAVVLVYGKDARLDSMLESRVSVIRDRMKYLYRLSFRVSIGSCVKELKLLRNSFADAENAFNYFSLFGDSNIVSSENVKSMILPTGSIPGMRYSEIRDLLSGPGRENSESVFETYFGKLVLMPHGTRSLIQERAVEIMSMLLCCARELGADTDELTQYGPGAFIRILSSENTKDVIRQLSQTVDSISETMNSQHRESSGRVLNNAKNYINQHYAEQDLNLSRVAEHVELSPGYVSQLFNRQEGCGFSEYLNQVRIERAKELLSQTHMKVYEVSDAVGFQNSKYFFQVFKQLTGKRPREFYENG